MQFSALPFVRRSVVFPCPRHKAEQHNNIGSLVDFTLMTVHELDDTIPLSIHVPTSSHDVSVLVEKDKSSAKSLEYERKHIYYLQKEALRGNGGRFVATAATNAAAAAEQPNTTMTTRSSKEFDGFGKHKRSTTLETLGTNYSAGHDYSDGSGFVRVVTRSDSTDDDMEYKARQDQYNKSNKSVVFAKKVRRRWNARLSNDLYYPQQNSFATTKNPDRNARMRDEELRVLFVNQVSKYLQTKQEQIPKHQRKFSWYY